MLKRSLLPAALGVCAALWLAAGCAPPPPPANTAAPTNPAPVPNTSAAVGAPAHETGDSAPVRDAVTATLQRNASLFPRGVRLVSVTVNGGIAALDFSPEFSQLSNMGDSTEAAAQKQLRAALASFPSIQKMHVTVQGKPYDSQMADWTEPFPVRDAAGEDGQDGSATAPKRAHRGGG